MAEPAPPATARLPGLCAFAVLGALLMASAAAMRARGPWYDEFYTLYVTRAGVPFAELFAHHWLADNHPPLFYALGWATGWLGDTVEQCRLINLAVLAGGGAGLFAIARARRGELAMLVALDALGLAALRPALHYAAELRSNCLALVAASLAIAALTAFTRPHLEANRRENAALTLALLLAFNVHFAATAITGAFAAAFGARLLLARDGRGALRLTACGAAAALPLAATLALQLGRIEGNTRSFWIPAGQGPARWAIHKVLEATLHANPLLTLAGTAGLALLAWQALRDRRLSARASLALVLAGGLVLAIALLLVIQSWRPFVVDRYLVALLPAEVLLLAIGAEALAERLGTRARAALVLALTLTSLAAIALNLRWTEALPSWNGTARAIAAQIRQCPGTLVHADTQPNAAVIALPPADNAAVVPQAYRWMAARYGFALEPETSRVMARGCPTLFWTEHVAGTPATAQQRITSLRARGYAIGSARFERIGDGWLVTAYPAGN